MILYPDESVSLNYAKSADSVIPKADNMYMRLARDNDGI